MKTNMGLQYGIAAAAFVASATAMPGRPAAQ
jgi:hypothetical protein